tara:strand:- start:3648 stop:4790 length:1143 start_codon:yes stop_codon:yes gene_type:complete
MIISCEDKEIKISTGVKISKSLWNSKTYTVRDEEKNKILTYYKNKLNETVVNLVNKNIHYPTSEEFKNEFYFLTGLKDRIEKTTNFTTLKEWINYYKEKRKKLVSKGTWRRVKMLELHLNNCSPDIKIANVDSKFWYDFQECMGMSENKYSDNYIKKISSELKIYIKKGILEGLPFKRFEFEFLTKQRSKIPFWLTKEELKTLSEVETKSVEEKNTLHFFLFQAYTGFGFTEVRNIRKKHIFRKDGITFIKIDRQKTGNFLNIPIHTLAYTLLKANNYMPIVSRKSVNKIIKRLCERAELDREIEIIKYSFNKPTKQTKKLYEIVTTHTARKSFGRYFMESDGNINKLSQIYGHKNEETTRMYIGWEDKDLALSVSKLFS